MTSRKSHPTPAGAVFIGMRQLQERWGGISHMTVERRIKTDPLFPSLASLVAFAFGRSPTSRLTSAPACSRRGRHRI
jgi:hypothetical protein